MDFHFQAKVTRFRLGEVDEAQADRAYWLSRPVAERMAAVEHLREQYHGVALQTMRLVPVVVRHQRNAPLA